VTQKKINHGWTLMNTDDKDQKIRAAKVQDFVQLRKSQNGKISSHHMEKRQRAAALQNANARSGPRGLRASVLECGSPLPLFHTRHYQSSCRRSDIDAPFPLFAALPHWVHPWF
jgi:hypothetical protein